MHDDISFIGESVQENEKNRIAEQLSRIRKKAKSKVFARVLTKNSFPKGTGIASSASGFAALTVAATHAIGLRIPEKDLTILARLGSGSACRSIPDGFVWWHAGKRSSESFAESLYPPTWWDIRDILCIVSKEMKKVSTSVGMDGIRTSPYWKTRIRGIPEKIDAMKQAIYERNIHMFGNLLEEDTNSMHCIMMTQKPPLFYWNEATLRVMEAVFALRTQGIAAYYTMDAGPNVHVLCLGSDEKKVRERLQSVYGVLSVIGNNPTEGARIIPTHLF